jgi:hypothetical protein
MLRPTVSRPVCLGISTNLGLTTRFLLMSDRCGLVNVGRSLWREDGSVVCNCWWSSPAQSFSGRNPVGLAIIFYCLRFETSPSSPPTTRSVTVEAFDPRLHTGINLSFSLYIYSLTMVPQKTPVPLIVACWFTAPDVCLPQRCLATSEYDHRKHRSTIVARMRLCGNMVTEPLRSNKLFRISVVMSQYLLRFLREVFLPYLRAFDRDDRDHMIPETSIKFYLTIGLSIPSDTVFLRIVFIILSADQYYSFAI